MEFNNYSLTNNEVLVLKSFINNEILSLEEIKESTKLNTDSAIQSIYLLEEKKYIFVDKKIVVSYYFTKEGASYAKKGLPERQLSNEFSYSIAINDLKHKFSEAFLKIAMSWFFKKKWGTLKDGILIKEKEIPFGTDEILLNRLYSTCSTDLSLPFKFDKNEIMSVFETFVPIFLKRKLINTEEKSILSIRLNSTGKKIIENGIDTKKKIGQITHALLVSKEWIGKEYQKYQLKKPSNSYYCSKIHPYQYIIDQIRQIFLEMGFKEIDGEIIQNSFWNFDSLFQPQDHPAREMQDTFYLNTFSKSLPTAYINNVKNVHENGWITGSRGWGNQWSEKVAQQNVLRTHTTSLTIQHLASHPSGSFKIFCIARSYRRETIDSTHTPEFEQLEGIIKSENSEIGFSHLLDCLREFYNKIGFEKVRFRPGYFPYTEPSVEPEVYIDGLGWIELGGAGVMREEVLKPFGITGTVLAWGLGVSRVAMLKLNLKDLRDLYISDINWLRKTPVFGNK